MPSQLLWLELIASAAFGSLLLLVPRTFARVLGLPPVAEPFWPRVLGAVLVGLAAATLLETDVAGKSGLGLVGHIAINMAIVLALLGLLIMGHASPTRRGRVMILLAIALLTVLSLVELAYV